MRWHSSSFSTWSRHKFNQLVHRNHLLIQDSSRPLRLFGKMESQVTSLRSRLILVLIKRKPTIQKLAMAQLSAIGKRATKWSNGWMQMMVRFSSHMSMTWYLSTILQKTKGNLALSSFQKGSRSMAISTYSNGLSRSRFNLESSSHLIHRVSTSRWEPFHITNCLRVKEQRISSHHLMSMSFIESVKTLKAGDRCPWKRNTKELCLRLTDLYISG